MIVGTCNGLICLCDHYFGDMAHVFVLNPSITKLVALPNPHKQPARRWVVFEFGDHPLTRKYKVIRIVCEMGDDHMFKIPPKANVYT